MTKLILVFLNCILATNMAVANCAINNNMLGAIYEVTTIHKNNNTTSTQHITLWRNGQQVAHEYAGTHMTKLWERMSNKRLRMVNYFDTPQRGIEYQPDEIKISHSENDWLLKRQLITNDLIHSMQHVATTKDGCDDLAGYIFEKKNVKINLQWLIKHELVKQYTEESDASIVAWKLKEVSYDPENVKNVFITRSKYLTTDYTDIGDNESDHFLLKMINLGFITHTSARLYDTQENSLNATSHKH